MTNEPRPPHPSDEDAATSPLHQEQRDAETLRGRVDLDRALARADAVAQLRGAAGTALRQRGPASFARVGDLLAAVTREVAGHAGDATDLIARAAGLSSSTIDDLVAGEEPALNFAPAALAALGRDALGLAWESFHALLHRDARSFKPETVAVDVDAALEAVQEAWSALD